MAEATRILLVRHGQTAWNADSRIQGHTDIELDALGHWQAERLALALGDEQLDVLYSSDLARARQTAARGCSCASTPACANAASASSRA